jgi:hypothetical protein
MLLEHVRSPRAFERAVQRALIPCSAVGVRMPLRSRSREPDRARGLRPRSRDRAGAHTTVPFPRASCCAATRMRAAGCANSASLLLPERARRLRVVLLGHLRRIRAASGLLLLLRHNGGGGTSLHTCGAFKRHALACNASFARFLGRSATRLCSSRGSAASRRARPQAFGRTDVLPAGPEYTPCVRGR